MRLSTFRSRCNSLLILCLSLGGLLAALNPVCSLAEDAASRIESGNSELSMDELDRRSFKAGPSPLDSEPEIVALKSGSYSSPTSAPGLVLDGEWQLAEEGSAEQRLTGNWRDAVPATVPGSVHAALFAAGKIPDPKLGRNDSIAHAQSFKTWWFKRTFACPKNVMGEKLVFDGVAIHCTVWLNGQYLGQHEGMFGGPVFDITGMLRDKNTLIVKLEPAPGDPSQWNNPAWQSTVVFNNVYGWHYSSIPALGLWRSVRVEGVTPVKVEHPFVATRDARSGMIDVVVNLTGISNSWSGRLSGTISPENFAGKSHKFYRDLSSDSRTRRLHFRLRVPEPRLWWPNDLGEQNLYRLKLSFKPDRPGAADVKQITFGIRTLEMEPLPEGAKTNLYNWMFVVNGRPIFIKGAGWCTMDSSMDFSRARYERFISLAKSQHIQMLRGWGSGMPETDDFYDLCDRAGILVMQEWPTAWNSHEVQPSDVLEETVRLNTLRLRNHASLAMYGGGNESSKPYGPVIDMMGRLAIELDGTRPFHRGEPFGGSSHNYDCWWGRKTLDHNLTMISSFWGEFGIASMPVLESVLRYLPDSEKTLWPAPDDGSIAHHTPIFNTSQDMDRLRQYSGYFTSGLTLKEFIRGSQMAQVVAVRHTLERARSRWPECAGALYYKLNDNYPAVSWSSVDWYGAPKLGHSFFQQAFAPLHAAVIMDSVTNNSKAVNFPVYLFDDANALRGEKWQVIVRAFDSRLEMVKRETFTSSGGILPPRRLGEFSLTQLQTESTPLLIVAEVRVGDSLADRSFYVSNFERSRDCLFRLPPAWVILETRRGKAVVTNKGQVPAVGVMVQRLGHLDTFTASENAFWLDPGETKTIAVNSTDGLTVEAFNCPETKP